MQMSKALIDEKLKSCYITLTNYLMSHKDVNRNPLVYIFHQKLRDNTIASNREIEISYGAHLSGVAFN